MERYFAARKHAEAMPRYSLGNRRSVSGVKGSSIHGLTGLESLGGWQPLGPGNIGGRTRSLVIYPNDPNTMWAGSVGGGVWKTTDGGTPGPRLSDLLPSIGIGAWRSTRRNPDVLYAGTGEWYTGTVRGDSIRGRGHLQDTDGGATGRSFLPPRVQQLLLRQ